MTDTEMILDKEHDELLEKLGEVSRHKTEVGRIFSEVLRIFKYHLDKEKETIVPLLVYMKDRLGDFKNIDINSLNLARAKFEDTYPEMMQEHMEMSKLISKAKEYLETEPDKLASDLACDLLHHVELEEEFLYPAAFASGDLVEFEREMLGQKIKY